MSIKNGYTKINNTLFWALMQLPKREQLVFTCLRIESDYTTHLTDPLSVKDIVEFTGIKRPHVGNALRNLEEKGWITKTEQKGYTYKWELSIAKLPNAEVYEFVESSVSETEVSPTDRFQVEKVGDNLVKTLTLGPRIYRYNHAISEFEMKGLWKKDDDAWETANGYADHLSETDKIELQSV